MTDQDKRAIRMAIQALNRHGQKAAQYFADELEREGNEDAEAWLAGIWEPIVLPTIYVH